MRIFYTRKAKKDLEQIEYQEAKRILDKIEANSKLEKPLSLAKRLKGLPEDIYRYRVGKYRVIFIVDNFTKPKMITVINIKHRKNVYK